ncbi:histidine kinase [Paenibacillus sp. J5C_2022]|uniref:sensor histidine kinase n=1 Tax=Paenibacillus sp. J5C2022 TaxID=2977129 RepID=UPI0021D1C8B6|nr:sensor histidine kinase [Paenibacillus sp. J5C2022]MCU6709681.1 histidine kinase [Paenibacillus sp. J5C2022]
MWRRISAKLFLLCLVFLTGSVALIGALSYQWTQRQMEEREIAHAQQLLGKIEQNLDLYFLLMQNVLHGIYYSAETWNGDFDVARRELSNLYSVNGSYTHDIYLIKPDLSIVGSTVLSRVFDDPLLDRKIWYDRALASRWTPIVSEPYLSQYSGWTVTMLQQIPWPDGPIVAALDMNLREVEERLFQVSRQDALHVSIVDARGEIVAGANAEADFERMGERTFRIGNVTSQEVASSQLQAIPATMSDGTSSLIILKRMEKFNWVVNTVVSEKWLQQSFYKLRGYYLALIGFGLILSLIVSLLISRYIRNPVYYLIRKMNLVQQGDLNVQIANNRRDEFGELASNFDSMLEQVRHLITDLNKSEAMKRMLEIQVLQSQINPHFLYNTLGSISIAVKLDKSEKVDLIIAALISIFEYGISDISDKVLLRDEIRNVKEYLFITGIRYNRVFELQEQIPEELSDAPVLRMILQPVVENALFHGYAGGKIEGEIRIVASIRGGKLVIEVADTGVGIPPNKLEKLLDHAEESTTGYRKRIGLFNIDQRIKLTCGAEYGVELDSAPDKGTIVRLSLPYHPKNA